MGDKSEIEWCDATWNPVTGCSHVSDGCRNCYAETLSLRMGWSKKPWTAPNAAENVILHPERLDQPLRWTKQRRIFVNSMSDLFHDQIPDHYIDAVFHAMTLCPQHVFQVLTKRPERMLSYVRRWLDHRSPDGRLWTGEDSGLLPANIWLGVSIEQDRWCGRADVLRDTPAAVRFVSAEPLLEQLPSLDLAGIDWLITGGESGHAPDARSLVERRCCPCCGYPRADRYAESCAYCAAYPEVRGGLTVKPWALAEVRRLRDLAAAHGTAFLHKQWGGVTPKSGGRLLDGRTWDELPEVTR